MRTHSLIIVILIQGLSAAAQRDPCRSYHLLDMHEGRRSSSYSTGFRDDIICDRAYTVSGWWYKFLQNGTNYMIPESCIELYHCGTVAPIWMNGSHPLSFNTAHHNMLCGNYDTSKCCSWTASVNVTRCQSGHGGDFFIYQLSEPIGCPLGFCATPSKENMHKGDKLICDRNDGCSYIMMDLSKKTGFHYEYNFTCHYVDMYDTSLTYNVTFRTSTTIECPAPDPRDNQTNIPLHRFYELTVQYEHRRKPGIQTLEPRLLVLVYNSRHHNCDESGFCENKTEAQSSGNRFRSIEPTATQEKSLNQESSTLLLPSTSVSSIITSETSESGTSINFQGQIVVIVEKTSTENLVNTVGDLNSIETTAGLAYGIESMTTAENISDSESRYDEVTRGNPSSPQYSTTTSKSIENHITPTITVTSSLDSTIQEPITPSLTTRDDVGVFPSDSSMKSVKADLPTEYTVSIILSLVVAGAFVAVIAIWCYKKQIYARKIRPQENQNGYNNMIYQVQLDSNGPPTQPRPPLDTNLPAPRVSVRSDTDEFGYLILQ